MKNKKKLIGLSICAVVVVIALLLCSPIKSKQNDSKPTQNTETGTTSSKVIIEDLQKETDSEKSITTDEKDKIKDDGNGLLKPKVESDTEAKSKTTSEKTKEPTKPVNEQNPTNDEGQTGTVVIGSNDNDGDDEEYSCNEANHHCENADYHAYIKNLELEGCKYCGSHNCKSFYATNEWGYTEYTPSLCPKYNKQNDASKVCPRCGLEYWSVDNQSGCFSYLQDTECECGEFVEGNTCHHH